jgi:hypothetical protein
MFICFFADKAHPQQHHLTDEVRLAKCANPNCLKVLILYLLWQVQLLLKLHLNVHKGFRDHPFTRMQFVHNLFLFLADTSTALQNQPANVNMKVLQKKFGEDFLSKLNATTKDKGGNNKEDETTSKSQQQQQLEGTPPPSPQERFSLDIDHETHVNHSPPPSLKEVWKCRMKCGTDSFFAATNHKDWKQFLIKHFNATYMM